MTSSFQKINESKHVLRRHLASQQIAQKLRLLDAMRIRHVAIHKARLTSHREAAGE